MCAAYNWWNSDPSKNRSTYSPSVAMSVKKFQYNRRKKYDCHQTLQSS